ncbi:MAG: CDP-alcohol phosphatidyltransferase family protein [Burkholderiales bacterium]
MVGDSWTHRMARAVIRPLVGGPITPNHLTTARLLTGVAACGAFAMGDPRWTFWGGVGWIVSAFLDRADGELARLGGTCSPSGHAYDYACDVAVNGLFFAAIGVGLRHGDLGYAAVIMGLIAGISVVAASLLSERLERVEGGDKKAYEGRWGFDFDDVLYLFGPIAWLGWLYPLLLGASIGAPLFAIWTWLRLRRISWLRSSD